tara:strand:+ start:142 stop:357 length:216 start_codon:yes stop_codon:yes gene_type:complete
VTVEIHFTFPLNSGATFFGNAKIVARGSKTGGWVVCDTLRRCTKNSHQPTESREKSVNLRNPAHVREERKL